MSRSTFCAALLAGGLIFLAGCQDGGEKGDTGPAGPAGTVTEEPAEMDGLRSPMEVSGPANGQYYTVGEKIVVTISLQHANGDPCPLEHLGILNLYMNGPRDTLSTKTAAALIGAATDRNQTPHHYVNLLSSEPNDQVSVSGSTITFTTNAIASEKAGTYTIGVWGVSALSTLDQSFATVEVQIGTATTESYAVGDCEDCHRGADSGKTYLHHIDPGYLPTGIYSLDADPVATCKNCHNQDGYAAYTQCSDGTRPDADGLCPSGTTEEHVPDPIVRRVHGVHNGANLANPFNTEIDAQGNMIGDFAHYAELVFPSDVRGCTKCHTDDSWKTDPSRLACKACHDNVDFQYSGALSSFTPDYYTCSDETTAITTGSDGTPTCDSGADYSGEIAHQGGQQTSDTSCGSCHPADGTWTPGSNGPISTVHAIAAPSFSYTVELQMTAPANGTHYVAGESPVLTVTVKDSGGTPLDPTTITEAAFGRANIFVSGPRARAVPVLTTAAEGTAQIRASVTNGTDGPWDLSTSTDLQLAVDGGGTITVAVSGGTFVDSTAATASEVVTWLNGDAGFSAVATASEYTSRGASKVEIKSNTRGSGSSVEILSSQVATAMNYTVGVYVPEDTHSYAANDFRVRSDPLDEDPRITRNATSLDYQLDAVAGLDAGTYKVWVEVGAAPPMSWALTTFQVGTATEEPKVAANCDQCHEDTRMHAGYFAIKFDTDICTSCHDYNRQYPDGTLGWASAGSNNGFGAAPLSRRIHGVHYGHYVDYPEQIHASYDYSEVIFPQDVRNCTKCHSDGDSDMTSGSFATYGITSGSWAKEPDRLACNGCHDSDAAVAHTAVMTYDPTPEDPWNGDENESCAACHGASREFSVGAVHSISDPYVPPYPRSAEE